jgi:hypothetical protein
MIESPRSYHTVSLATLGPATVLEVVGRIDLGRRREFAGKMVALLLSRMMRNPLDCRKVEVG